MADCLGNLSENKQFGVASNATTTKKTFSFNFYFSAQKTL